MDDTFQQYDNETTNKIVKHFTKNAKLCFQYKKIEKYLLEIVVYSDSSFNGNENGSSQVGFVIFFADKHQNASIIECSSIKLRKIARPVPGAEGFGIANACVDPIFIQHGLNLIITKRTKVNI